MNIKLDYSKLLGLASTGLLSKIGENPNLSKIGIGENTSLSKIGENPGARLSKIGELRTLSRLSKIGEVQEP